MGIVGAVAIMSLCIALCGNAIAAGADASATSNGAQAKIDQLTGQIEQMSREQAELMKEVQELKKQVAVKPTGKTAVAAAGQPTLGQRVSTLQEDLDKTRKDLSENLGINIHGLVDAGYNYNLNNPGIASVSGSHVNQFRAFDTDPNSFEFRQFELRIARTSEHGVGFVGDLNFGRVAEALRSGTRYSSGSTSGEVDPTQAYLTYTIPVGNGINLMAGKYVTLLGYEVIPTYNAINVNESRGLIFTLGMNFTNTGIRASYAFNDMLSATLGITNGWDNPSDNNSGKSVEGQIALAPLPSLSMTVSGMYGPEQDHSGASKLGVIDPIVTWTTPIPGLTVVGQYLYAHESGPVSVSPLLTGPNDGVNPLYYAPNGEINGGSWSGAGGYFIYVLNDKLQFALRGEYFRDADGIRTGIRQSLGEVSFDTTYNITPSLVWRSEYRHDESNTSPFLTNRAVPNNLVQPGVNPIYTISGQDTILTSLIYTF